MFHLILRSQENDCLFLNSDIQQSCYKHSKCSESYLSGLAVIIFSKLFISTLIYILAPSQNNRTYAIRILSQNKWMDGVCPNACLWAQKISSQKLCGPAWNKRKKKMISKTHIKETDRGLMLQECPSLFL